MKSIILIIPYFGKLPNYFTLWLKSIEYNPTINFLLITDDKTNYDYPKNIKVIYSNFETVQKKIKEIYGTKVKIKNPYKLCDYRPFYNVIFEAYVKNYDYWGYCDLDLIFGNIRKFLTDEILEKYEKIYTRGHLTIFKNSPKVNLIIKSDKIKPNYYNYKEAMSTNYSCHFDEWGGTSKLFEEENIKQYDNIDFADLCVKDCSFYILFKKELEEKHVIFEWDKGNLYYITNDNMRGELIYAHFQKRKMEVEISSYEAQKFIVVPNKFIDYKNIDDKFIKDNTANIDKNYSPLKMKTVIKKIKSGAIKQRIYREYKKIFYNNLNNRSK